MRVLYVWDGNMAIALLAHVTLPNDVRQPAGRAPVINIERSSSEFPWLSTSVYIFADQITVIQHSRWDLDKSRES